MKTFCTMIAVSDPSNLLKDVGMIPFSLKEEYLCMLASYIDDKDGKFLSQVKGLKLISLGKSDGKNHCLEMWNKDCASFLRKNSKRIDVLNLYFLKHSILYGIYYKVLNRRGTLYLKMDGNAVAMENEAKERFDFIRHTVYRLYLKFIVDKVSIESTKGFAFMKDQYNLSNDKLLYLPNGFDDRMVGEIIPWDKKDNAFLTVGRLDAPEKRTEIILEAASKVKWNNGWELRLVGPANNDFIKKIPGVKWLGPIYEHNKLYQLYNKSKVFCLMSAHESFGIVCVEAQAFGEYLLLSSFSTSPDFTNNEELGRIVYNADGLAKAMQEIIDDDSHLAKLMTKTVLHAQQYKWSHLGKELYSFLEN